MLPLQTTGIRPSKAPSHPARWQGYAGGRTRLAEKDDEDERESAHSPVCALAYVGDNQGLAGLAAASIIGR